MFRIYLWSRAIAWSGTALSAVALPVLLFQLTGNAALAGLLAAVEAVPYLLLGLPVGALVDRWDTRSVLVLSSLANVIAAASVPAAAVFDTLTPAHLILVAIASSVSFVFFDAASFGALPALVGRQGIASATARMMTVSTIIGIVLPPVGGLLTTAIGGPAVLLIDAACYAAGALLLGRIHGLPTPDVAPAGSGRRLGAEILEGLRAIRDAPVIRDLTLLGIGNSVAGGAVSGLLVVAAVRNLGLSDDSPAIGVLFAATAVGALAASWLIGPLQLRVGVGAITISSLLIAAAALALWASATSFLIGAMALLIWQAGNTMVSLNGIVTRQTLTPDRLQGRVNTTARMIAWGGQPIGAATAGLIAEGIGTREALAAAALVLVATAAAAAMLPVRRAPRLAALR